MEKKNFFGSNNNLQADMKAVKKEESPFGSNSQNMMMQFFVQNMKATIGAKGAVKGLFARYWKIVLVMLFLLTGLVWGIGMEVYYILKGIVYIIKSILNIFLK